jgi:YD repeat-containing protein
VIEVVIAVVVVIVEKTHGKQTMKQAGIQKYLLAALCVLPLASMAEVNPKNGNFHITYLDLSLKRGSHALEIRRTYNSISTYQGWFGYGWGSLFETKLTVLPDGSAVITENGNGLATFYRTPYDNTEKVKAEVAKIVKIATGRDMLDKAAATKLAGDLLNDETLRLRQVIKYKLAAELPLQAVLDNQECGKGSLQRVPEGYQRKDCGSESHVDIFDMEGRMIRREFADGYSVSISYISHVPRSELVDSYGQRLNLTWTNNAMGSGGLREIRADDDNAVTYRQDARGDLVQSDGRIGNNYEYTYDEKHNLTRIAYSDGSDLVMTYAPVTSYVLTQKSRNGETETLSYGSDPKDADHYWTQVVSKDVDGRVRTRNYDYKYERSATGAEQLARMSKPARSTNGDLVVDGKGRVIRRTYSDGQSTEYIYDPRGDNLILVISGDRRMEFHYDANNNLTQIQNSAGESATLRYNAEQHIDRMAVASIGQGNRLEKRELRFKYNVNGKPSEIVMAGVGKVTVQYDLQGNITQVKSVEGSKIALQIISVFQHFMEQVNEARPAL